MKISPMKGVMKFDNNGKLSIRYVSSYEILQRVGKVAYESKLTNELSLVHSAFHVCILKKCIRNPVSILPIEGLGVGEDLCYEAVVTFLKIRCLVKSPIGL